MGKPCGVFSSITVEFFNYIGLPVLEAAAAGIPCLTTHSVPSAAEDPVARRAARVMQTVKDLDLMRRET